MASREEIENNCSTATMNNNSGGHQKITLEEVCHVEEQLRSVLSPAGLEAHPFKIGWYNKQVSESFYLPYPADTLAFIIISTPSMFEKAFIPYVSSVDCTRSVQDPLDQCMRVHLSAARDRLLDWGVVEIIHDFELTGSRRPRVLVQTAGHVAGAVRFYQRADLTHDPWPPERKVFGVCLHPEYGGWFALRGVLILTGLTCPALPLKMPREILKTEEEVWELLRLYNDHWRDWTFRDLSPAKERYSEEQIHYFNTKPGQRRELIEKYRSGGKID